MALFRWRDNLSVGVPVLDRDHKHLIQLLNRLHFMVFAGDDRGAIADIIAELVHYTQGHFEREETMMQACAFPGFEPHREMHRRMVEQLEEFADAHKADPAGFDAKAFYDLVADWLLLHVMTEDIKIKPFIERARAAVAA
jgi:hemerythrin-like metal-binding protein